MLPLRQKHHPPPLRCSRRGAKHAPRSTLPAKSPTRVTLRTLSRSTPNGYGLVAKHGQDAMQAIIAEALRPVRAGEAS
jgi:hypothetical protein